MIYPLYQEMNYQNPVAIFALFAEQNGAVFLDSAQLRSDCARYSFIAIDPFQLLICKNSEIKLDENVLLANPFSILSEQLALFPLQFHAQLPPFQGGVAGFFSYDLCQHLENISSTQIDDMNFPDMAVGFYDLVIAFDHELQRAWIFSSGYPEREEGARKIRAAKRLEWLVGLLNPKCVTKKFLNQKINLQGHFTREEYCDAVNKVKEYILAGDIFEANISQRFIGECAEKLNYFELYQILRHQNPAPFAAYLNFDDTILASASPERFLKLQNRLVETRPIKGTRSRSSDLAEDQRLAKELENSEKDRAENVMIVDLLRNDLSRVCENHSVMVPQLCGLESFAAVHHLVSVVQGKLLAECNAVDLLEATFPGGSITGAPKIRAMEIIAEIEPTKRGPYCGCIGYLGFNGDMDTSITIRTFAIKDQRITIQAGGAVVLDSDPESEYAEMHTKANPFLKLLSSLSSCEIA